MNRDLESSDVLVTFLESSLFSSNLTVHLADNDIPVKMSYNNNNINNENTEEKKET